MGADANVKMRIFRFDPSRDEHPWWGDYDVPAEPGDRVLDALHYVKWYIDGTLGLRRSCAQGVCGSDAMMINGRNRLACKVLLKDLSSPVSVEPIRGYNVEKDLIVDMEPFFAGYKTVLPWLMPQGDEQGDEPERERIQTPDQQAAYDDSTKCILCAACTTSCPIFWRDETYIGPAAIVAAHRFINDSRDGAADLRLDVLDNESGAWKCRTVFNCTDACPRGIKVTERIQEVKRALLRRRIRR